MSNQHNQQLPPEVERHLKHCQKIYNRMVKDGRWPWQKFEADNSMLK